MCSGAYLFASWRQNMWFIVRVVGVAAGEAVMFFLCCLSCTAAVLAGLLYVHPDMHPQAVCLSLFLLKLSSEVSEGLALLIPDTVNEKQASYTGRLIAREAMLSPPLASQCETVQNNALHKWRLPFVFHSHLCRIQNAENINKRMFLMISS